MFYLFFLGLLACVCVESVFYDAYTGNVLSKTEVKAHIKQNTSFWCVYDIQPCDPLEGRRIDGSCNNLKHPSVGASHTPTYRLLPAVYDKDFEPRRSKSGKPLPLSRAVRTGVLAEGRVPNVKKTQLLTHFWVYIFGDFITLQDTVNYNRWKTHCCEEKGKEDRECIPNIIPDDDPVHRFSSIRCMNLTRPISFQSVGCTKNDTVPERFKGECQEFIVSSARTNKDESYINETFRINGRISNPTIATEWLLSATPTFDLSHIYGTSLQILNEKARLFERGLLKFEVENDKIWPPSIKTDVKLCNLNQLPHETRCHDTPNAGSNTVLGSNLFVIWTWRFHNRIATLLHSLNPCWDDDKLFFTARDIAIAITVQLTFYEFMPDIMGYDNLVKEGIILPHKEFRDIYDENVLPRTSLEFPYVHRWAHVIQEGKLKMYDANGYYLKEHSIVNMTLRTGYLVDNLEYITQGAFRQPAASYDNIVDSYMAETVLGYNQLSSDVFASDLTKGRYFGFAPYIQYRELCSGKTYKTFEDLLDVFEPKSIALLKEKYEHLEDIDLMTGLWLEKRVNGIYVPVTVYCVTIEQLRRMVVSDRHWYERPNRPNAFTLEQLLEVRKASISQFMCAVGDTVTEIQPKAFFLPGKGNEIRSCEEIQKINLLPWKDSSCNVNEIDNYKYEI